MEDEENLGSDEDLARGEQENKPKKPTDEELIEAYIEDLEDKREDEA